MTGRRPGRDPVWAAPPRVRPGLPASAYLDPDRYREERAAVFSRQWTAVGHATLLSRHGDYLATSVAGTPVVVVNDDGRLRAHLNICRHRAGPLVWEGSGSRPSLVCRYHGWAYGLDGVLTSARDFGAEPPVEQCSLVPVSVADWRGVVFVNPDPSPPPLEAWLGAVVAHSRRFAMERFEVTHHSTHDIAANWKVYAENYQEGYHIPLVHPGLHRQIDASRYTVEVDGAVAVHSAPTRDGSVTDGAWLWRFPGFALNLYRSGMCVESFWPTGPTTTRVSYTFCFDPDSDPGEAEAAVASSLAVLEEDRVICEAVQSNLASGASPPGVLSPRHESGVALVHDLVAEALADHGGR